MGSRRAQRAPSRALGQHFLKSERLAERVVDRASITAADVVVEIGAGRGRLTRALAARAHLVVAVELDPRLVTSLITSFSTTSNVLIVAGDFLTFPLPGMRHRAVGNVPFSITTRLLHRLLDDVAGSLERADLIVAEQVAFKRVSATPSNLLNLGWAPWWEFMITDRFAAADFRPPARTGAAMLTARRRSQPLLPGARRAAFLSLLRRVFVNGNPEIRRTLAPLVPPRRLKRLADELGFQRRARPTQLDVHQWAQLFRALDEGGGLQARRAIDSRGDTVGRDRGAGDAPRRPGSRRPSSNVRGSRDGRT